MVALQAGALILGLAVIGLLFVLDRPEDAGRLLPGYMSREWLRRHREGR